MIRQSNASRDFHLEVRALFTSLHHDPPRLVEGLRALAANRGRPPESTLETVANLYRDDPKLRERAPITPALEAALGVRLSRTIVKAQPGDHHDTAPPDREHPPLSAYEDAPQFQGQVRDRSAGAEGDDSSADGDIETADGLPPDYISAASLWNETFERYWLTEMLIERGRIYEFFGRYKGGKTIAAIDLACHLAAARSRWGDRRLAGAFVVWIAGEAVDDVKQRIAAWLRRHDIRQDIPLYIRVKPAHMDKEEFAKRVYWEVSKLQKRHTDLPPLIVIDTVARNMSPGCDENSIQGLGAFINNLIDIVARPTNATAICIHHPGHGDQDRGRGHSSFPGAVDGIIKVTMDKSSGASVITVSTSESRSTVGGDSFSFRIETQELPGSDNFGNPIDAPVLRYLPDYRPPQPLGKNERQGLAILEQLLATTTTTNYNIPYPSVLVTEWRAAFKAWVIDESSQTEDRAVANNKANIAWTRVEKGLHEKGITRYDGINKTRVSLAQIEEGIQ